MGKGSGRRPAVVGNPEWNSSWERTFAPKRNPDEQFEVIAAAFYEETGFLAPGKDVPAAFGGVDEVERRRRWTEWLQGK